MKLIIFDFDGVLVDTLGIVYSINTQVNQGLSMEEYKSFFEGNIYNAKRFDGTPKKHHPNFERIYEEETRALVVPVALKEVLKKLRNDYILVIISSSYTSSIKKILQKENIAILFQDVLGADVHRNKVFKIRMILEKYKITQEEAVYVTDTVGDILEARECGLKSIAVSWGFCFHDVKTLQKANPARIVSTPDELIKTVLEIL